MSIPDPEKIVYEDFQEHWAFDDPDNLAGFLNYLRNFDIDQRQRDNYASSEITQTATEIQDLESRLTELYDKKASLEQSRSEARALHENLRTNATIDRFIRLRPVLEERYTDEDYRMYATWTRSLDIKKSEILYGNLQLLRGLLDGANADNPKYLIMYRTFADDDLGAQFRFTVYTAISKPLISIGEQSTVSALNPNIMTVVKSLASGQVATFHYPRDGTIAAVRGIMNNDLPGFKELDIVRDNLYGIGSKDELDKSGLLNIAESLKTINASNPDKNMQKIVNILQLRAVLGLPVDLNDLKEVKQTYLRYNSTKQVLESLRAIDRMFGSYDAKPYQ